MDAPDDRDAPDDPRGNAGSAAAFQDHFSAVAAGYARHRPRYPAELFRRLADAAPGRGLAWDCATGNGQAAVGLAAHFDRVLASDASAAQIAAAEPHPRVEYRVAPAEAAPLGDAAADLVTVAQAAHWFDAARFHAEVRRVARPGALVAVWCYGLHRFDDAALDAIMDRFYWEEIGPSWPPDRRHIDEGYARLSFPFPRRALEAPPMTAAWTLDDLMGYLETWSAVQRHRARHGEDPLPALRGRLAAAWGGADRVRPVRWPVTLLAGTAGQAPAAPGGGAAPRGGG